MSKSVSEATARVVEEFKASSEMKDLNIVFGQKAFIKGFELCEGRMAQKFSELDLSFLKEEPDEEAGPSSTAANPSPAEPTPSPSEPTTKVCKPAQEPKAVESTPTSSAATPPKVEDLE